MVDNIRIAEQSIGTVHYGLTAKEKKSKVFRRSLFVTEDMKAGEAFTENNLRSIRPANGIEPKHLSKVLGKKAKRSVKKGTPLRWQLVK